MLSHPHQQWGEEAHNALFEAGGECFLMEGQFNRKYSSTSGSAEQSVPSQFVPSDNKQITCIHGTPGRFDLRARGPQDGTVFSQALDN